MSNKEHHIDPLEELFKKGLSEGEAPVSPQLKKSVLDRVQMNAPAPQQTTPNNGITSSFNSQSKQLSSIIKWLKFSALINILTIGFLIFHVVNPDAILIHEPVNSSEIPTIDDIVKPNQPSSIQLPEEPIITKPVENNTTETNEKATFKPEDNKNKLSKEVPPLRNKAPSPKPIIIYSKKKAGESKNEDNDVNLDQGNTIRDSVNKTTPSLPQKEPIDEPEEETQTLPEKIFSEKVREEPEPSKHDFNSLKENNKDKIKEGHELFKKE